MIAQIDKQHAAMVANAVTPAGEPDFLPDEGFVGFSAVVRTIAMHGSLRHGSLSVGNQGGPKKSGGVGKKKRDGRPGVKPTPPCSAPIP
jgi:hypothetical protein